MHVIRGSISGGNFAACRAHFVDYCSRTVLECTILISLAEIYAVDRVHNRGRTGRTSHWGPLGPPHCPHTTLDGLLPSRTVPILTSILRWRCMYFRKRGSVDVPAPRRLRPSAGPSLAHHTLSSFLHLIEHQGG